MCTGVLYTVLLYRSTYIGTFRSSSSKLQVCNDILIDQFFWRDVPCWNKRSQKAKDSRVHCINTVLIVVSLNMTKKTLSACDVSKRSKRTKKSSTSHEHHRRRNKIGRWEQWEHETFLHGLKIYGKGNWKLISQMIPTR